MRFPLAHARSYGRQVDAASTRRLRRERVLQVVANMASNGKFFCSICWLVAGAALARASMAADNVTFQDNVLPILRSNCLKCHNPDKFKGDLDLTTLSGALTGGGSGPVVSSGDPDGSKIIKAITHAEEPNMPPNSPPLADKDIETIKRWI